MDNKDFAKKRLMFIQKEDYNFLAYSLLILLNELKCFSEENKFKDFRKIAYLVDFINSHININDYSASELSNIYSKAQLKKQLLSHLLIVLRNRKFIEVEVNGINGTFDLWLKKENIPKVFFDKKFFFKEINNIAGLKKISRLRTVSIKTLTNNLFASRNVLTWEI
ncbi:MAG: hypothetical protein ACEPOV_03195 [Hyphomicrobiales bacterium]